MLVVLYFVVASRLLVLYEYSRLVELQCGSVLVRVSSFVVLC